jgi:chromosome segregation ATPase
VIEKNSKLRQELEAVRQTTPEMSEQLKETVEAQRNLIKQLESANEVNLAARERDQAEIEDLKARIIEQEQLLADSTATLVSQTEAAKSLSNMERNELISKVETLKTSDARQKKKLTSLQQEVNSNMREISALNAKYAGQLEAQNTLKQSIQLNTEELSSLRLQNSEYKLQLQTVQQSSTELKAKLEGKFHQQDKVL